MAKNFVVYLQDDQMLDAAWIICDDKGNPVAEVQEAPLEQVAAAVEGRRVVIIIPSQWVTLSYAVVPGGGSKALKAIPFALEDQLSEDVEDLHFAVGDRQGNYYPVAIVADERMQQLQARLEEVQLRPVEIRADALALPRFKDAQNGWTGLSLRGQVIVRLDDYKGYAIEQENAELLLTQSLHDADEADEPAGLVLFHPAGGDPAVDLSTSGLSVEQRDYEHPLTVFAHGVFNSPGINLLQGRYSYKQQLSKAWKPWIPALGLVAVILVMVLATKMVEQQRLNVRLQQQKDEMANILKRTFPSVKRIVDPRKQMATEMRKLGNGGSKDGFVKVVSDLQIAISETGNITLNSISYKTGRMDLDLEADQLSTLDSLKQKLEGAGKLTASIESANQSNNRIRGRIRVEVRG